MKVFRCGEVIPGCDAVFHGQTDEDILSQVAVHAEQDHEVGELSPELVEQVRSRIRTDG